MQHFFARGLRVLVFRHYLDISPLTLKRNLQSEEGVIYSRHFSDNVRFRLLMRMSKLFVKKAKFLQKLQVPTASTVLDFQIPWFLEV